MKRNILLISALILVLTITGCGGGSGKNTVIPSTSTTPVIIKDVTLSNGSGDITINTNNTVSQIVAIPYNLATTSGDTSTTVTITTGFGKTLSKTVNSTKIRSSATAAKDLTAVFRKKERELVGDSSLRASLHKSALKTGVKYEFYNTTASTMYFKVYDYENKTYYSNPITASKKYAGQKCVIYLDQAAPVGYATDANITTLGQAFDNFYSTETGCFGSPSNGLGDIDNNEIIYILLTPLYHGTDGAILGYFDATNEYTTSAEPNSNQKEMLYITTYTGGLSESSWMSTIKGTLAHEFQHLIFFNNRYEKYNTQAEYDSETWIDEGLSMVAEDITMAGSYTHYSALDDYVVDFFNDPAANSLCTWDGDVADYGPVYMFMRYFADRCGEDSLIKLISSSSIGTNMLASVSKSTFNALFQDWLAALAFDYLGLDYSSSITNFSTLYLYRSMVLASDFGTLNHQTTGVLTLPDTTGAFIFESGLSGETTIKVSISTYNNPYIKLRLIMIPVSGKSFSVTYN